MPRILSILLGLVLLAAGVVLGITLAGQLTNSDSGAATVVDKPDLGSAPVVRTDLIERASFPASLEFRDRQVLAAQLAGTITQIPAGGQIVRPGDTLIEIDGSPVIVMAGVRPMWRPLADGIDPGPDVVQLEENLVAGGYLLDDSDTAVEPDDEFDDTTADAVEQWREDVGLSEGRQLELGRVVFLTEPVRVGDVLVDPGDVVGPGVPLMEVSATAQHVRLELPVDDRDLASVGGAVVVVLPDDTEVTGSITDISRVVTSVPGPGEPIDVVEVTIELDDPSQAGGVDRAPVDVELESDRAEGVLAVPVNALVALAEGGYGVQLIDGDQRRLVGVEIGTFLDTLVEIDGEISEGDLVVVPR